MSDYDQTKGELCPKCGWAMKFPEEPCRCELERENAALRELVGSVPREVFLDNGETSQRALANYEAFNAARKEGQL